MHPKLNHRVNTLNKSSTFENSNNSDNNNSNFSDLFKKKYDFDSNNNIK